MPSVPHKHRLTGKIEYGFTWMGLYENNRHSQCVQHRCSTLSWLATLTGSTVPTMVSHTDKPLSASDCHNKQLIFFMMVA